MLRMASDFVVRQGHPRNHRRGEGEQPSPSWVVRVMPKMVYEVTLGNILNLITTLVGACGVIVAMTMAYSSLVQSDALFEQRLKAVEVDAARAKLDRDLLLEMRSDLRFLRLQVEQAIPAARRDTPR